MRLPDPQRSYAVLIGTSTYCSRELADLPAVRNNLNGLAEVLTEPTLGGLLAERCIVLHDSTDMRTVYSTLRQYATLAEDTLLVYFAGHGRTDVRNELYLGLTDTDPDELRVSALPFDLIRDVLGDSPAANRVLILDCCFSGRAIPDMGGPNEAIVGQVGIEGTYTLTATPATAMALAPVGATYTAFTGELLTLLRTGIPDGPPFLTFATIYRQLLDTLTTRGLPRPRQRGIGTVDQLALTRNRAHGHDEGDTPNIPWATPTARTASNSICGSPGRPTVPAIAPAHEAAEQSVQPLRLQGRLRRYLRPSGQDSERKKQRSAWTTGHPIRRIGVVAAGIGLLAGISFLAARMYGTADDAALDSVAYSFDQGILIDDQANRYVVDSTNHGHVGDLKIGQVGEVTVIDHPGHGKALHFPPPCAPIQATTCPRALVETISTGDLNPGTHSFSYGADVLVTPTETQVHASLIQKGETSDRGGQWKLHIEDSSGRPSCVITGQGSPTIYRAVATVGIADGGWHAVRCAKTPTALTIYIDSVNQGHAALPAGLAIDNSFPMRMGGHSTAQRYNDNQFSGALDNAYFRRD